MYSTFKHTKVSGISVVVPDNVIPIEDEIAHFDNNPKMLSRSKKILGLGTRYIVGKNCNATAVDLCEAAARKLIADMQIDVNEIDAIVVVLQRPDYTHPSAACLLHGRLNLPEGTVALHINHGCAGYVYGLWTAANMIESGACKKILLLAGYKNAFNYETPIDFKEDFLFGDAGSASLLEYSEDSHNSFYSIHTDGKGHNSLINPFGGLRITIDKELLDTYILDKNGQTLPLAGRYMDGGAVFIFSVSKVPPSIKGLMAYAGIAPDDIDFFALHQANKQIIDAVAAATGIPQEKYSSATFTKYGNQSTASIPALISHLLRDRVSAGCERLLLSGFGVGLAWANAIIELDNIYCPEISVQNFDHIPSRDEEIAFWMDRFKEKYIND